MGLLHIHAQSQGRIFEVIPEEIESTELVTEEAASQVIVALFDEAIVDDVTIQFTPATGQGQRGCSIHIQVECAYTSFKLLPCTKEYMQLAISKSMEAVLKELFGAVLIDTVIVQPSFMEAR